METSEQTPSILALAGKNGLASTSLQDGAENLSPEFDLEATSSNEKKRNCKWGRTAVAFFLMGILVSHYSRSQRQTQTLI